MAGTGGPVRAVARYGSSPVRVVARCGVRVVARVIKLDPA